MVYLDKNSTKVLFPRVSIQEVTLITFINQITKEIIDCPVKDASSNNNFYTVDLSRFLSHFTIGQYDYTLYNDKVAIGTGIMQFGDYKTDLNKGYSADIEVVQYDADSPYTPLPDRVIKITENGTYDVDDYNKANVNVKSDGVTSSFGIADVHTKTVGLMQNEIGVFIQYTNKIYLTLAGDVWANKDLYIGLSRYKKQRNNKYKNKVGGSNKYVLYRDFRKQLATPLKCYKNDNNVYAYTDGSIWYMHRDPNDFTTWCDVAYNRAYCVNELISFVGNAQDDYGLTRYTDGDLYDYVNVNKNATTVDDIIAASLISRADVVCYTGYMQNTPIVPIKISDMKLRVNGTLTDKTLNDITKEEFDSYDCVEFLYPYPTEYIMNRFTGDIGRLSGHTVEDYFKYRCYDGDKLPNYIMLKDNRGYLSHLIGEDSKSKTNKHLIFNIYNEDQIYKGYPSNYVGINKTLVYDVCSWENGIVSLI